MLGTGLGIGLGVGGSAAILASIVAVTVDGSSDDTLNWQFSQPVNSIDSVAPSLEADDGGGMASPTSISSAGVTVAAVYTGKTFTTGNAWRMLADPSAHIGCAVGFSVPESGTTT